MKWKPHGKHVALPPPWSLRWALILVTSKKPVTLEGVDKGVSYQEPSHGRLGVGF